MKNKVPSPPPIPPEALENLRKQGVTLDQLNNILQSETGVMQSNRNLLNQFSGLFDESGNPNPQAIADLRSRIQATQMAEAGLNQQALGQLGQSFQQDALGQMSDQIGLEEGQRLLAALRGELPASAGLTNQDQREFEQLREAAGRQGIRIDGNSLANATTQSTAGNQLLQRLRESSAARRDAERQNIIAQGTGANLNRLGFGLQRQAQLFNQAQGLRQDPYSVAAQQLSLANQYTPANLLGFGLNLANSFQGAAQPYIDQRNLQYQAQLQNASNKAGLTNSLIGAGAFIGGSALAGPIGGAIAGKMAGGANPGQGMTASFPSQFGSFGQTSPLMPRIGQSFGLRGRLQPSYALS